MKFQQYIKQSKHFLPMIDQKIEHSPLRDVPATISLDSYWLPSDNLQSMATISQTRDSSASIRVALVIESGRLKPVWFEQTDNRASDRMFIQKICSVWSHHHGSAKIINFAVTAGGNGYQLSLNTQEFTWMVGVVEESPFPSYR